VPAYPGDTTREIASAFETLPRGSVVSEVARRLLERFTSGDIEPGTRLPPERALAESLGVGRSAVREALAALELLGIVDVRPGSGTYLRGAASELLPKTLSWGLMLGQRRTRDLIEVRNELEVQAARLAAERATEEELALMREHLEAMREHEGDLQQFVDADLRFHLQIGLSAGNPVLLDLLQSLRSLIRVWVDRALHDEHHIRLAVEEHTRVYESIASRDPARADEAMHAHMLTASQRLVASLDSNGS
jgi:GntR family transcriptional repressor for pyruvate dehydrogenase complex